MIVATRFGSNSEAAAHLEMESAQYWISILKMGEIFVEEAGWNCGDDGMANCMGAGTEDVSSLHANDPRIALMNITASGTIVKPDKQPLP
jgi:hypothetical protein